MVESAGDLKATDVCPHLHSDLRWAVGIRSFNHSPGDSNAPRLGVAKLGLFLNSCGLPMLSPGKQGPGGFKDSPGHHTETRAPEEDSGG